MRNCASPSVDLAGEGLRRKWCGYGVVADSIAARIPAVRHVRSEAWRHRLRCELLSSLVRLLPDQSAVGSTHRPPV